MAASSAADGSVGIRRLESRIIPMTITGGPKEVGTIMIRRPFDHSGYYWSYDSSLGINLYNGKVVNPLETRAWTLQEELHARRLVKFTGREMIFQCMERRACECGEVDVRLSGRILGVKTNFRVQKNKYHSRKSPEIWYQILEEFRRRDTTFAADRLPALSVTTQRLFHKPSRYVAGLLRDELPRYLLWATLFSDKPPKPKPKTTWLRPGHGHQTQKSATPVLQPFQTAKATWGPLHWTSGHAASFPSPPKTQRSNTRVPIPSETSRQASLRLSGPCATTPTSRNKKIRTNTHSPTIPSISLK
jgi:hypothetical protein